MRIYGPNGTTLGTPSANVRKTSSTGFSLPDAAATQESRAAVAPKAAANIDALLALQGIEEDPAERRKRSVQRGKGALDVLCFHDEPVAGCRRQPEILLRRPRP